MKTLLIGTILTITASLALYSTYEKASAGTCTYSPQAVGCSYYCTGCTPMTTSCGGCPGGVIPSMPGTWGSCTGNGINVSCSYTY